MADRTHTRSSGCVIFRFEAPRRRTTTTRPPGSLDERRRRRCPRAAAGVCGPQRRRPERLRGLDGHQGRSFGRVDHRARPSTTLIVSVTGTPGTAPSTPGTIGVDHAAEEIGRRQRARGVVDADHVDVVGHVGQPGARRSPSASSPPATARFVLGVRRRHDDDDPVATRSRRCAANGR